MEFPSLHISKKNVHYELSTVSKHNPWRSGKTRPVRARSTVSITDSQFLNINGRRADAYHLLISLFALSILLPTPRLVLLVRGCVPVLCLRFSSPNTYMLLSPHVFVRKTFDCAFTCVFVRLRFVYVPCTQKGLARLPLMRSYTSSYKFVLVRLRSLKAS